MKVTIFANNKAALGDHHEHPDALAVVVCDDRYAKSALGTMGVAALKRLVMSAKRRKHFFSIIVLPFGI